MKRQNPNRVRIHTNTEGRFEVRIIATQETLATFDSLWLAGQMVCRINRNLDK